MTETFDCLRLKGRILTDHEKIQLSRINLISIKEEDPDTIIGFTEEPYLSMLDIELTHCHHLDAILTMIAQYIYPQVKDLIYSEYPPRRVK